MSLRAALASPLPEIPPERLAATPRVVEIARLLLARHGGADRRRPAAGERQALLQRLRRLRFDWSRVTAADRLETVWVLWEGSHPPAEHAPFLEAFLAWIEAPWRRLQACRLAQSWTAAFDPDRKSIRTVADWLAAHSERLATPWPGLAAALEIFSIDRAPSRVAEAFLAAAEGASEFFEHRGLATGGLSLAALDAAAAMVGARAAEAPRLALRLIELAALHGTFRPEPQSFDGEPRVAAIRRRVVEALLLPWQGNEPPALVKERTLDRLLAWPGDARIKPGVWAELAAPVTAVMHAWLKERTIAAFFRRAGTGAREEARGRRREDFWRAYLPNIDDAWLIAGTKAAAALGASGLGHGRLLGCPGDHAVLLLAIAGMTILETSDGASERVWLPGNALAPPLNRADEPYWAASLAAGSDFSSGYGPDGGSEERLRALLDRRLGRARD